MSIKDMILEVGKLTGTNGIKGEVKFFVYDKYIIDASLKDMNIFLINLNDKVETFKIEKDYYKSGKRILKLYGIDNINDVEKYSKMIVCLQKDLDIIEEAITMVGYHVYDKEMHIGEVVDEMENSFQSSVKVLINGNSIWIPVVDRYVLEIDDDNKKIFIADWEELA